MHEAHEAHEALNGLSDGENVPDHSRRRVLKTAVAGAVATTLWAEPTLKGIARRPAYAATGSSPVTEILPVGNYPIFIDWQNPGERQDIFGTPDSFIALDATGDGFDLLPEHGAGCSCEFDPTTEFHVEVLNSDGSASSLGFYDAGIYIIPWDEFFGEPATLRVLLPTPWTCS